MLPASKLTRNQKREYVKKEVMLNGEKVDAYVTIRYDDECKNGHNTFSITGKIYKAGTKSGAAIVRNGTCHDVIRELFPEFEHLIKWHLCSSDGPLHYVPNTIYHAADTDYKGFHAGEYSAYKKEVTVNIGIDVIVYTTKTMHVNKQNNPNLERVNNEELAKLEAFLADVTVPYTVTDTAEQWSISKGKEVDIDAARSSAIWGRMQH